MTKTFRKKSHHKSHKQKLYNMRGCARGGALAYTGEPIATVRNPFLAYTGKGGASTCGGLSNPAPVPININAANPAIPNTGPVARGDIVFNEAGDKFGGCSGSCGLTQTGGKSCNCGLPFLGLKGGAAEGTSYPNGLVGQPWTPEPTNVLISGNHNYYPLNTLKGVDISREMISNPPITQKAGKKRHYSHKKTRHNHMRKRKHQRGGTLSNFLTQDLINLGREFEFGIGSAYNALSGYPAPVNPLPWKGQFAHK